MTSLGFNIKNGSLNVLSWEGLTFKQIVSSIQKNTNSSTKTETFFHPRPLKHYRRNIGKTNNNLSSNNERQSLTISNVIEQPGGSIYTIVPICFNNGVEINTNIINSKYENNVCNTYPLCMSNPINALIRVRSSGMIRKRTYNVNNYQYLQNSDKSFSQNQFNYINNGNSNAKPGSALALLSNNTYVQNGMGQFNIPNKTVIYKPNNSKYGQQGGVSSSSRIERIKYETIQKIATNYKITYGTTSNDYKISVTYGGNNGSNNGITYGRKDLYNVPTS